MDLLSGRLLAKNAILNILGQGLPMLMGLFCIPILIEHLGLERFGVLSLVWLVIGYFNLFDLGLGRATIKLVAEKLGEDKSEDVSEIVWTSAILIFLVSLIGASIVFLMTPWLLKDIFKITEHLLNDSERAFYYLALGIPVVAISTCFRGGLEAKQRFGVLSLIQIFLGIFAFGVPVVVLQFSDSVASISAALVIGRVIVFALLLVASNKCFPNLLRDIQFDRLLVNRLLRFGGWITVSNTISPIMVYFDRFLIGALVPLSNLAFYTTPYEIVSRLHVFPSSIVRVLFPAFSTVQQKEPERIVSIFDTGNRVIFIFFFPIILLLIAFSPELLTFWLGAEFSASSHRVLEIISIGIFINALAQIPFSFIQSLERADITAKLHLIEFPIYFFGVWYLTTNFGLVGAAMAWTIRVTLDAWALSLISKILVSGVSEGLRKIEVSVAISVLMFVGVLIISNIWYKLALAVLLVAFFTLFSWIYLVRLPERVSILNLWKFDLNSRRRYPFEQAEFNPNSTIAAIYNTCNPSENLIRSVKMMVDQVDRVVIVDTLSEGLSRSILDSLSQMEKVYVMYNSEFLGDARSLNLGIERASELGAEWVITLDQNSYPSDQFVSQMIGKFADSPKKDRVFAVFSALIDEETGVQLNANCGRSMMPFPMEGGHSGNLFKIKDILDFGAFNEGFFRDYLYQELYFRAIRSGLRIVPAKDAHLICRSEINQLRSARVNQSESFSDACEIRSCISKNRFLLYFRYGLLDPEWAWQDFRFSLILILKELGFCYPKGQKLLKMS